MMKGNKTFHIVINWKGLERIELWKKITKRSTSY